MTDSKKTLRLPDTSRARENGASADGVSLSKKPKSHKPWSQTAAKRAPQQQRPPTSTARGTAPWAHSRNEETPSADRPPARSRSGAFSRSSTPDSRDEVRRNSRDDAARRSPGGERSESSRQHARNPSAPPREDQRPPYPSSRDSNQSASKPFGNSLLAKERRRHEPRTAGGDMSRSGERNTDTSRSRNDSPRDANRASRVGRSPETPKFFTSAQRDSAPHVSKTPVADKEKKSARAHVHTPTSTLEGVRVSKLLAARGLCSRREADEYIERGWVLVNGKRVVLGARAQPEDTIMLAPEAQKQQTRRVTILLHKPIGYVSGQPEPGYQPAIVLIKPEHQFPQDNDPPFSALHLHHLAPAGRLDIESTGLLVLTQDGRVARTLIGENSRIDKEYLVRVEGSLTDEALALLNHGLTLDDEVLKPAQVEWINDDQLRFVLHEGRKRQIRRMCEAAGLTVTGLKRVRIGRVRLSDLPLGQWRYLRDDESFD